MARGPLRSLAESQGWVVEVAPGDVERLKLAADKPARSRYGDQLPCWTYVGKGGSLEFEPGDVEMLELAADKPARSR